MTPLTRPRNRARFAGTGNASGTWLTTGPTLDLAFAGVPLDLDNPNGDSIDLEFIPQNYQVATQYSIWEPGMALVSKTFSQIITFTRASSATYFDATGTLQTATTDVPRFDYNPSTLAPLGLLIEEARTNLLLYSTEFDNAWWTANGTTVVTPNAGVAPDGTTTAELVTDATGNLTDSLQRSTNIAISNATAYTLTAYIKLGTATDVGIRVRCPGGSASNIGYFANGQDVGNGWRRVTANITSDTTGALVYFGLADGTFYIWGAQLEAGAFPTSYIPTTSIAATRAVDEASVNTLSPWYNAAASTIYAEASVPQLGRAARLWAVDDGSINNMVDATFSVSNAFTLETVAGGAYGGGSTATGSITANTIQKTAAVFTTSGNELACLNGGTVGSAALTLPSASLTRLLLGRQQSGVNICGWLRRLTYYPRALSSAELQAITT